VLLLEVAPRNKGGWPAGEWRAKRHVEGLPDQVTAVSGASPWQLKIPLAGGKLNQLEISLTGHDSIATPLSFHVRKIRIEDAP
jgi:hypothetical protein